MTVLASALLVSLLAQAQPAPKVPCARDAECPSARCIRSFCAPNAPPLKELWFVSARDGKRCELPAKATEVAETERKSLVDRGRKVLEVKVAAALSKDVLPKECVPADAAAFFKKFPHAKERARKSLGSKCETCGCAETWYFCARALESDVELLRPVGYAPVR